MVSSVVAFPTLCYPNKYQMLVSTAEHCSENGPGLCCHWAWPVTVDRNMNNIVCGSVTDSPLPLLLHTDPRDQTMAAIEFHQHVWAEEKPAYDFNAFPDVLSSSSSAASVATWVFPTRWGGGSSLFL